MEFRSKGIIVNEEKFEQQKKELDLSADSEPGVVVRAYLARALKTTGRGGIDISIDACGINTDYTGEIFWNYLFEIGGA